jgi:hypothetical protein
VQRRIDHHGDGADEVHAHHGEGEVAVGVLVLGQHRRGRHRRRGAAHAGGAAGQQAEVAAEAEGARHDGAEHDGAGHRGKRDQHRQWPAIDQVAERQPRAVERHADAQQGAAGELDAGFQRRAARQGLQRHADRQRDDQRRHEDVAEMRPAADVGEEGDGSDRRAHGRAGRDLAQIVGRPQARNFDGDALARHSG